MLDTSKKSYTFSFITSLYVSILGGIGLIAIELWFFEFDFWSLFFFMSGLFVISFLVIQIRVEDFIFSRFRDLYEHVSLLADFPIEEEPVTTDMEALTKNVKRFAENKKLEIEALKIRENYRREFIGNVAHELKTPLFMVGGYISTLLDGALEDRERTEQYLDRAQKGIDRLTYIINDLDMIAKLESGELDLEIEDFDIIECIESVFELLEMKAQKLHISLTFDKEYPQPIWVLADRERIEQVVTNLVVNSIKYGKEKGTTEISIERLTPSKVIVRITDNGEGFKKEEIPRLFERFYRGDKSGSRTHGGSGLGLSIVKHILEAHKEKIYVESDYGVGSEFSFSLTRGNHP